MTRPVEDSLVFVVGARRSGTNWLQRILQAHPDIVGPSGETFVFSRGIEPLSARFHHAGAETAQVGSMYADRSRLLAALRAFCDVVYGDLLAALGPAQLLVDCTPEHVGCLELIGAVYPKARVIHMIRDGRDVVRSLLSMSWGPEDPEEAIEEWRAAVVEGRRAGERLGHYREVRYEELLRDPVALAAQLYEWLGVADDGEVLEAARREAARQFTVDPKAPVVSAGKWREGLSDEVLADLGRLAGGALEELGYVDRGEGSEQAHRASALPNPESGMGSDTRGWPPRLAGRLRRRRETSAERADPQVVLALRDRLHHGNHALSSVLTALAAGGRGLDALVPSEVQIDIVCGERSFNGNGPAARDHFLSHVSTDPVWQWRQARADVYVGVPASTALVSRVGPDGEHAARLVVVTLDQRHRIRRLAYHHIESDS